MKKPPYILLSLIVGVMLALVGCFGSAIESGSGDPLEIAAHPRDTSVEVGGVAFFSVTATGAITFQWVRNDTDTLEGETLPFLILTDVSLADNGDRFKCVVGNTAGRVASNPATLTVTTPGPLVVVPQAPVVAALGGSAVFTAQVTGDGVTYQWVRGTFDTLPEETSPTLVIPNVSESMDGTVYHLVVRNDHGTTVSDPIVLNVHVPRSMLLAKGETVYSNNCTGCHGIQGEGGRAPPHANADFVMNNRQLVIRLVLRGNFDNPPTVDTLTVNGVRYQAGGMPGWGDILSDTQIASLLTYIRVVLNDSLVTNCNPNVLDIHDNPVCQKTARSAADIAMDSVSYQEVRAVRESLFTPF